MPELIDTHCHIHESEFYGDDERVAVYQRAVESGVTMICVSTSVQASREAVEFCRDREQAYPVIGVHPHDADGGTDGIVELLDDTTVIGIGEIGLDYYYQNSSRQAQIRAFEQQLQWAQDRRLPVSFHVRNYQDGRVGQSVWEDFWPIYDNFRLIGGVLHSFTDTAEQAEAGLSRGLHIGINGISTFTRDREQQEMYRQLPLKSLVLETDAPFLTPAPLRGTMNEPKFVGRVAEHMATQRDVSLSEVAAITTANARQLFSI